MIVLTEQAAADEALRINKFTHDNKIAFIWAETNGLFGSVAAFVLSFWEGGASDSRFSPT